jgi:hypothetical protein
MSVNHKGRWYEIPTDAENDYFPVEMAAFEKIFYALHSGQPSSGRSFTGKYAPLPPFAPEPLTRSACSI